MSEILHEIRKHGLLTTRGVKVYVTLLGNISNVALALGTLHEFNTSGNVHLMVHGSDLYVSELPTIHAIHTFAQNSNPRYKDIKISNGLFIIYLCILSEPPSSTCIRKACVTMVTTVQIGDDIWYTSW